MSKDDTVKEGLFTLPLDYTQEVLEECRKQIDRSNGLLQGFFEDGLDKPCNARALPYVIEVLWLNHCIRDILFKDIEDPVYHESEHTKEKEYIMMEETIYQLQALLISRHHSNLNLTRISYSVSLH